MLCFPKLGDYGRLGNAMFQYATMLGVANKTGYTPWCDSEKLCTNVNLHDVFKLTKCKEMPQWKQVHTLKRIWKEPHFHFCEEIFNIKDDTGLHGYLQSEKYFKHIEDTIRSEFEFSKDVQTQCKEKIKEIKKQIDGRDLISIHVRLGDYKSLEHVFVPLMKTKYYTDAITYMADKFDKQVFIIFSDEIEICKQLFQGDNIAFAEGGHPHQDMCLMSMCDHNIIANSSFSWWASWLNKKKKKTVIAPKQWFIPNEKEPKDTKDLYCKDWIVI